MVINKKKTKSSQTVDALGLSRLHFEDEKKRKAGKNKELVREMRKCGTRSNHFKRMNSKMDKAGDTVESIVRL